MSDIKHKHLWESVDSKQLLDTKQSTLRKKLSNKYGMKKEISCPDSTTGFLHYLS